VAGGLLTTSVAFASDAALDGYPDRLERCETWRRDVVPQLSDYLTTLPGRLRLALTARSALR
jgi:hypothetical protein